MSTEELSLRPPPSGGTIDAKRARKRSRYLSPPYTDTDTSAAVQVVEKPLLALPAAVQVVEEPLSALRATDVLSTLCAAALQPLPILEPNAAQAISFLALYRRKNRKGSPGDASAAAAGHKPAPNLSSTAPASGSGSSGSKKKNPQQNVSPPAPRKENVDEAGHKKKKASKSDGKTLNASLPVPNLPLKDVRKNLEKMILSLTARSSLFKAGSPEQVKMTVANNNLVAEMQCLLAKVDKLLHDAPPPTVHQHHH